MNNTTFTFITQSHQSLFKVCVCKEGWYRDHTQAFTHYLIPVDTYIAAFVPDIYIIHINTVICFSNHLIGHTVPSHCSCSSMLTHEHFLHVMLINEICAFRAATLCHIGSSLTRLEEIVLIHEEVLCPDRHLTVWLQDAHFPSPLWHVGMKSERTSYFGSSQKWVLSFTSSFHVMNSSLVSRQS